jgi:hypothetical protein
MRMLKTWQSKSGQEAEQIAEGRYGLNDPHSGKISLDWKGNHIWGCIGVSSGLSGEEHLEYLRNCIQECLVK